MGAHQRSGYAPLRVIMFSSMQYEISAFEKELGDGPNLSAILDIVFVSSQLDDNTVSLTKGALAVCVFATDDIDAQILQTLHNYGIRLIASRYTGSPNVDIDRANQLGIHVTRVPAHAPSSIAEYTVSLMLSLNRKIHIAYNRIRDGNLSLHGLIGFDLSNRTIGIIGTGKVGRIVAKIMNGFGCQILAYDMNENQDIINKYNVKYCSMRKLLANSDILSLHAPLVPSTYHMINNETLPRCKKGVHIIDTSRGGLIDIPAIIDALSNGTVGGLAMDVYEGYNTLFLKDNANDVIDRNFLLLKSLPNVLITGNQSALTTNAFASVAKSTIKTLVQFQRGEEMDYVIKPNYFDMRLMTNNNNNNNCINTTNPITNSNNDNATTIYNNNNTHNNATSSSSIHTNNNVNQISNTEPVHGRPRNSMSRSASSPASTRNKNRTAPPT